MNNNNNNNNTHAYIVSKSVPQNNRQSLLVAVEVYVMDIYVPALLRTTPQCRDLGLPVYSQSKTCRRYSIFQLSRTSSLKVKLFNSTVCISSNILWRCGCNIIYVDLYLTSFPKYMWPFCKCSGILQSISLSVQYDINSLF